MYITILGNSNSGKTTTANYIAKKYKFKALSPAKQIKQLLTTLDSRLYKNCLEESWAKELNVPNTNNTYLSLLVKLHHFFNDNYSDFPALCLKKQLEECENGVITSVRSMSCVKLLENYQNYYIVVYKENSKILTSDIDLKEILNYVGDKVYPIHNTGSLYNLYSKVDYFINLIKQNQLT